jgi:aminobenzoyl-glutamate utilization protein B
MKIAALFLLPLVAFPQGAASPKEQAKAAVFARAKLVQEMTDMIFSLSELGYQETETSKYVTGILEKNGFKLTRGVAGMPTAWVAEWGSGKPVVGLMADIDGLPETYQKPGIPWHEPLIPNGPGHGEGHNAGQAVQVAAALAAKDVMQKNGIRGTLRVYPGVAEELLGSRTYMVNAGLFKDLDIMLSAHIASEFSTTWGPSGSGLISAQFSFHGRSAHGAGSPWAGRSALDAVELMNIGWNYRREHIRPESRSHYIITHGGDQPNVVPPEATVWYYFREWDYGKIKELHEIGSTIASAAAQMAGVTTTQRIVGATWPGHFNKALAYALYDNIKAVGMPQWSEADQQLAKAAQTMMKSRAAGLKTEVGPFGDGNKFQQNAGSDDISEVGWNLPTVVLRYPGNIPGMTGHHWSSGIAMATPIAHKGATHGAAAQAMTVIDVLTNPKLIDEARAYFAEQTKQEKWQSLIPVEAKAPIEFNKEKMDKFRPSLNKLRYDPAKYSSYLEQLGVKYPTLP